MDEGRQAMNTKTIRQIQLIQLRELEKKNLPREIELHEFKNIVSGTDHPYQYPLQLTK